MGKYFGTDGVRGVAGADLTCELAMKIGRGAAAVLTGSTGHRPRILIGKDTRQSGDMLEAALTAGLCSVGADVESLGVLPTPAVAYLVRKYNADAGVVISASHNPMEFNGIKIFAGSGLLLLHISGYSLQTSDMGLYILRCFLLSILCFLRLLCNIHILLYLRCLPALH